MVLERLFPGLDAAIRLAMLGAMTAGANEISAELAPGVVEARLLGGKPALVVTLPADSQLAPTSPTVAYLGGDDDGATTSRLDLRRPDGLKARIEQAARREGLSLNTWLVRAAAAVADRTGAPSGGPGANQRFTGVGPVNGDRFVTMGRASAVIIGSLEP